MAERSVTDCVFYMTSACRQGDGCPWRHDPAAARCRTVCPTWASYAWCDGRCGQQHPADPTQPAAVAAQPQQQQQQRSAAAPPCSFFAQGRCAKGDACAFRHDARDLAAAPPPQSLREAAARQRQGEAPEAVPPAPAAAAAPGDSAAAAAAAADAAAILEKHSLTHRAAEQGLEVRVRSVVRAPQAEGGSEGGAP